MTCDRNAYSMTVRLKEKQHTDQTFDGETGQPAAIQNALDVMENFVNENRLRQ